MGLIMLVPSPRTQIIEFLKEPCGPGSRCIGGVLMLRGATIADGTGLSVRQISDVIKRNSTLFVTTKVGKFNYYGLAHE